MNSFTVTGFFVNINSKFGLTYTVHSIVDKTVLVHLIW